MTISYLRLQQYLDKIADSGNLDATNSGHRHGRFWDVPYATFRDGTVPHKLCNGTNVPIINEVDKTESAFYKILLNQWCTNPSMPQMPKTGPFVDGAGYSITLDDGVIVSGAQVLTDIGDWLTAGANET